MKVMRQRFNATGLRFHKLVALKFIKRVGGETLWLFKCDCGVEKPININGVIRGHYKSCGCGRKIDITGKKFNKLTAIKFDRYDKNKEGSYWIFKCDCGNLKSILASQVKYSGTRSIKSCGCSRYRKGYDERFSGIYLNILSRCNNPRNVGFPYYGGRGIKCLWKSFESFKRDVYKDYLDHLKKFGPKNTTIDRIDNSRHYSKKNCRWATMIEQAQNKRNNISITIGGKTKNLAVWSRILGIPYSTLHKYRIVPPKYVISI